MRPVAYTLQDLRDLTFGRTRAEVNPTPSKPAAPATLKVTGLKFGFSIQWSQVKDADGYRIAITATNNLAAPDRYIGVEGNGTLEYTWLVGDIAITRQFSVQSFKRGQSGATIYSNFHYPLVSATCKDATGASDSAPASSPSAPVSPSDSSTPSRPGAYRGAL